MTIMKLKREMNGWWKEILGVEEYWEWDWGRFGKVWYGHLYGAAVCKK